ncbi:MAG: hypothetical protein ACK4R8_09995 [Thiobacillus sp.]
MFDKIKANLSSISKAISPQDLKALGATNIKLVSERTLQFDVPQRADGTNRIKVTVTADGFIVRGYRYEETDAIPGVSQDGLATALKNIGTI